MDKSNSKHKFTIVEKGGRTLQSVLVILWLVVIVEEASSGKVEMTR